MDLQCTHRVNPELQALPPTHRDLFALVVGAPGQGDADGAGAELSVEDHHHDLVGWSPALFQRLVGLINKILKFLKKKHFEGLSAIYP